VAKLWIEVMQQGGDRAGREERGRAAEGIDEGALSGEDPIAFWKGCKGVDAKRLCSRLGSWQHHRHSSGGRIFSKKEKSSGDEEAAAMAGRGGA
jgi:hypothetical protein